MPAIPTRNPRVTATVAVIAFAADADLTYDSFGAAVGVPMTVVLPLLAALSVTSEWSQRSGLATFTMVPQRSRVIGAKAVATVLVASPHLSRPVRRIGEGIVTLLALSCLYLSRGFPTDLVAAIVLGRRDGLRATLWFLVVLPCIHFCWGIGFVLGFLSLTRNITAHTGR